MRFAWSIALAALAAYTFCIALDSLMGGILGAYPVTEYAAVVFWAIISTVALLGSRRLDRNNRWAALPYAVFGALAVFGGLARSRPHELIVAAVVWIYGFVVWKASEPTTIVSKRDAWLFALLGWDPTWQRLVSTRTKTLWIVTVTLVGAAFGTIVIVGAGYLPKEHRWVLPGVLLLGLVVLTVAQVVFRRDVFYRMEVREDQRAAKQIQSRLIPAALPELPGFELAGHYSPFRVIGGDYYDAVPLDENRLLIAIADVSGKGTGAALLTANVQALLHFTHAHEPSLEAAAAAINAHLVRHTEPGRFVTMVIAELDARARRLRYVNAGHNPPLGVLPDGRVLRLEASGLPLGIKEPASYASAEVEIPPGTVLLFYTDGLSERADPSHEMYGEDRIVAALRAASGRRAGEIVEAVSRDADRFARGAPQEDDVALLLVRSLA